MYVIITLNMCTLVGVNLEWAKSRRSLSIYSQDSLPLPILPSLFFPCAWGSSSSDTPFLFLSKSGLGPPPLKSGLGPPLPLLPTPLVLELLHTQCSCLLLQLLLFHHGMESDYNLLILFPSSLFIDNSKTNTKVYVQFFMSYTPPPPRKPRFLFGNSGLEALRRGYKFMTPPAAPS